MSPPTAPSTWALVPDDLFTEFLSLLPVKSLVRFKCVSHSWNNLISDSNFVKFHLKKSKSHNPNFTLITRHNKYIKGESPYGSDDEYEIDYSIIPYPISSFLNNPSFTLFADQHYIFDEKTSISGSCNGLICLTGVRFVSATATCDFHEFEYWLRLWNPATRAISEKFGCFIGSRGFNFNFGCDNSTGTFKVVASLSTSVRVLSFGDSVWRNIESFPVVPVNADDGLEFGDGKKAVYVNDTLNWLAIRNYTSDSWFSRQKYLTVEQLIIVSLNMGTETYNMYRLPRGFTEVPPAEPTVGVLGDCLCFSCCYFSYNDADFIIWQMKKFGDEESWTQFLKINLHDLQLGCDFSDETLKYHFYIVPLFLSKDGDTLVLHILGQPQAILYNWRDRRGKQSGVSVHKIVIDDETCDQIYWHDAKDFVESLISIC